MSVFRKKGSPYYQVDFQVGGHRFRASTGTASKRAAQAFEARWRADLAEHGGLVAEPISLYAAAERFYQEKGQFEKGADNTDRNLETLSRIIGKDVLLRDIDTAKVADFRARRRGETTRRGSLVSGETVNRELKDLRRLLLYAKDVWRQKVAEIKWSKVWLAGSAQRTREIDRDQEQRLFKHLRPDLQDFVRFALMSGARLGEVIGLTWDDVDYRAGEVTFRNVKSNMENKDRTVPLTPSMVALIANQKGRHDTQVFTFEAQRSARGRVKGDRYPLTRSGWRRPWKRALKAAGLTDVRFHDTRHTAASRTLRASGNLAATQDMLGHASVTTTMKYSAVLKEDVRRAMAAAQDAGHPHTIPAEDAQEPIKALKGNRK